MNNIDNNDREQVDNRVNVETTNQFELSLLDPKEFGDIKKPVSMDFVGTYLYDPETNDFIEDVDQQYSTDAMGKVRKRTYDSNSKPQFKYEETGTKLYPEFELKIGENTFSLMKSKDKQFSRPILHNNCLSENNNGIIFMETNQTRDENYIVSENDILRYLDNDNTEFTNINTEDLKAIEFKNQNGEIIFWDPVNDMSVRRKGNDICINDKIHTNDISDSVEVKTISDNTLLINTRNQLFVVKGDELIKVISNFDKIYAEHHVINNASAQYDQNNELLVAYTSRHHMSLSVTTLINIDKNKTVEMENRSDDFSSVHSSLATDIDSEGDLFVLMQRNTKELCISINGKEIDQLIIPCESSFGSENNFKIKVDNDEVLITKDNNQTENIEFAAKVKLSKEILQAQENFRNTKSTRSQIDKLHIV